MSKEPTLDGVRHAAQIDFVAAGTNLVVGDANDCPIAPDALAALQPDSGSVQAVLDSGLTALVYRLRIDDTDYALKKARPVCLVKNLDGQTSFLNELQRRGEIAALRVKQGGFDGIVPTLFGSLRDGIILSPWVAGKAIDDWDERRLQQIFASGIELVRHGFFEWDFSPGNLLDDGQRVWLFDFGYMYRFDPRSQFNSAGTGDDVPAHHLAERFETRNFFAWLLGLEKARGQDAALAAFRLEKEIAIDAYRRLRSGLAADGATPKVLDWLDGIVNRWRSKLDSGIDELYLEEGWRSHRLDLDDDLRGQTCTPGTLAHCDWMLAMLRDHFAVLAASGALDREVDGRDRAGLSSHYAGLREKAVGFQVR